MNKTMRNTFIIICSLFATNTYAVDGVLEINETCATQLGCFSGDTPGYPVTIDGSAGVSYKLTSSLIIPTVITTGIIITSPSISIDLNGFEIVGLACVGATVNCTPANGLGHGIFAGNSYDNISISNGSITGMGSSGIFLFSKSSAISKIRARWNRIDGIRADASATISNNKVSENGSYGIQAGSGSSITNNTAYQNSGDGINAGSGSTVTNNTAYDNSGDGIQTSTGCTVQKNTVQNNTGYGLNLSFTAAYRENVITGNSSGTVNNGYNMGNNFCNTNATCP